MALTQALRVHLLSLQRTSKQAAIQENSTGQTSATQTIFN